MFESLDEFDIFPTESEEVHPADMFGMWTEFLKLPAELVLPFDLTEHFDLTEDEDLDLVTAGLGWLERLCVLSRSTHFDWTGGGYFS